MRDSLRPFGLLSLMMRFADTWCRGRRMTGRLNQSLNQLRNDTRGLLKQKLIVRIRTSQLWSLMALIPCLKAGFGGR
jgi:hypothetical protein